MPHLPEAEMRRSFSLIEIVLVATMLGFFLLMCSQMMIHTLQLKTSLQSQMDQSRNHAVGWNLIYQDLANALGIYYLDGTVQAQPPVGKKNSRVQFAHEFTRELIFKFDASLRDENFLEVVVSAGLGKPDHKGAGFRKVAYRIVDNDNGEGELLLRGESPWSLGNGKDTETDEAFDVEGAEDERRFALLADITIEEIAVYNGEEWVEEWDSTSQGELPLALRFKYRWLGKEESQERIIPVPISLLTIKEPLDEI